MRIAPVRSSHNCLALGKRQPSQQQVASASSNPCARSEIQAYDSRHIAETTTTTTPHEPWLLPRTSIAGQDRHRHGHRRPHIIAHRGNSLALPENSMLAFQDAARAGADALETDLHLTRDGVVVLSHDATLKRCFGVDVRIGDCDWPSLSALRTTRTPHTPLCRFDELLAWLAGSAERDHLWVLLDIKLSNDMAKLFGAIAKVLSHVECVRPWEERILIGCWAAEEIPLAQHYLPGYQICWIGGSLSYARKHFFPVAGTAFAPYKRALCTKPGRRFLADLKTSTPRRPCFIWTVDDASWVRWAVDVGVDGVISGDVDLCRRVLAEGGTKRPGTARGMDGSEWCGLPMRHARDASISSFALPNWLVERFFDKLLALRLSRRPRRRGGGGGGVT